MVVISAARGGWPNSRLDAAACSDHPAQPRAASSRPAMMMTRCIGARSRHSGPRPGAVEACKISANATLRLNPTLRPDDLPRPRGMLHSLQHRDHAPDLLRLHRQILAVDQGIGDILVVRLPVA